MSPPFTLEGDTIAAREHPKAVWQHPTAWHRGTGEQDRPLGRGVDNPDADMATNEWRSSQVDLFPANSLLFLREFTLST